jgi:hypothetical protein
MNLPLSTMIAHLALAKKLRRAQRTGADSRNRSGLRLPLVLFEKLGRP